MRFEKALKYMKQGEKVRRVEWGRNAYIKIGYIKDRLNREREAIITPFGNEINLNRAILEVDWEVVDD